MCVEVLRKENRPCRRQGRVEREERGNKPNSDTGTELVGTREGLSLGRTINFPQFGEPWLFGRVEIVPVSMFIFPTSSPGQPAHTALVCVELDQFQLDYFFRSGK